MKFDIVEPPEEPASDRVSRSDADTAAPEQEAVSGALLVRRVAERTSERARADVLALKTTLGRLRERIEADRASQGSAHHRGEARPPASFRVTAFSPVSRSHDDG